MDDFPFTAITSLFLDLSIYFLKFYILFCELFCRRIYEKEECRKMLVKQLVTQEGEFASLLPNDLELNGHEHIHLLKDKQYLISDSLCFVLCPR